VYDFRNLNGHDFTGRVRDQQHCGACYSLSFIQAVESRIKLKHGKDIPLSPQHILSCNYLNEGCEGGWAMMNGFFAENAALVGEDCAKYMGTTVGSPCSKFASCKQEAKVSESYFLGDSLS